MPTIEVEFRALGTPQPQGSTRAFMVGGKPRVTSDNPKLADWRRNVRISAHTAWKRPVSDAPCHIEATFLFVRPKGHFGAGKNANVVKESKRLVIPRIDVDKLLRALCDGMTGVIYRDDSQVSKALVCKRFCLNGEPEGVFVKVLVY